jgi:hypothetical protein
VYPIGGSMGNCKSVPSESRSSGSSGAGGTSVGRCRTAGRLGGESDDRKSKPRARLCSSDAGPGKFGGMLLESAAASAGIAGKGESEVAADDGPG